ncbi:MAG TPA: outer membrane beta-barrel protein [Cytophagales bacterium]|nr:outer membrane beta-barrel protein [Cytophagales bacterium]
MNLQRTAIFILLLHLNCAVAQQYTLKGKVNDIHGQPLSYADVLLFTIPDSTQVGAVLTDDLGTYSFSGLYTGEYFIRAYITDINETISSHISIDNKQLVHEQDLNLQIAIAKVDNVVITSQRSIVRQQADKMVMDVEGTLANSGLTAEDVLRRAPGITVDKDGKVSIKGKSGVQVMLDDRPMYMGEEQLSNLIKSIPSDLIKEIEVITSPSAKYDAIGNAGIVNIRLKEGAYEGLNGTANLSLGKGRYHKSSTGTTISYKKKKLLLDASYQYNNKEGLSQFYIHRKYLAVSSPYSRQDSDSDFRLPESSHNLLLKGSMALSDKSTLGFNVNGTYSHFKWDGGSKAALFSKEGLKLETHHSRDAGYTRQRYLNGGLDYAYQFDTSGTKLSASISFNKNAGDEDKRLSVRSYDSLQQETSPFLFYSTNDNRSDQLSTKVDFTKTMMKSLKLELGFKINLLDKLEPRNVSIIEKGYERDASNHFDYKENIYAGYVLLSQKVRKWKLQAGLRVENTQAKGTQTLQDTTFKRGYINLFPSANVNYSSSAQTSYSLMYSRRIQRPESGQLNPVLNIVDPYTAWGGSPYIYPEYTHNIELAQSAFAGFLITTLNYAHTLNPLNWVNVVDSKSLQTVGGFRNMEWKQNIGVSVAVNLPITRWWQSSNFINVYHNQIKGDLGQGASLIKGSSFTANATQTFRLPKGIGLELSGNYEGAAPYGVGTGLALGQLSIALQKKVLKDKGTLKLAISDIFWTYRYRNETTYSGVYIAGGEKWDNRVLMLTFNYRFGKRLDIDK